MTTALLIIDMQADMQTRIDSGRDHVNADAQKKIAALAGAFRAARQPVIHVRHRDDTEGSPFHPSSPGFQPLPCDEALGGELVLMKTGSSAFPSTNLERHLRTEGITKLMITGAVAGFCVNSTVRSASDLGFKVTVVRDAVLGFDLPASGLSARQIFDVTMGLLQSDFATIVDTDDALTRLSDT